MKNLIIALLILPLVLLGVHQSLGNSDRAGVSQKMPAGSANEQRFTVPSDDVLRQPADLTAIPGNPRRRNRTSLRQCLLEQTMHPASMWMSSPEHRSSARSISTTPIPAGQVSPRPLEPDHIVLGVEQRLLFQHFSGGPNQALRRPLLGMYMKMGHLQPGCDIV